MAFVTLMSSSSSTEALTELANHPVCQSNHFVSFRGGESARIGGGDDGLTEIVGPVTHRSGTTFGVRRRRRRLELFKSDLAINMQHQQTQTSLHVDLQECFSFLSSRSVKLNVRSHSAQRSFSCSQSRFVLFLHYERAPVHRSSSSIDSFSRISSGKRESQGHPACEPAQATFVLSAQLGYNYPDRSSCTMGSLMPGWDSLPNSTKFTKRSKSSLTKEEIESYWRHKQQEMEVGCKERNAQNANTLPSISETKLTTTTTVSPNGTATQEVVIEWPQPTASSPDWWTRSNSAFLNAPSQILDSPEQAHHCPYVRQIDRTTQYNRSISSVLL